MGGSRSINLLSKDPDLNQFVVAEDDYMRQQRLSSSGDALTQTMLEPLWRIRSAFFDAAMPMEAGLEALSRSGSLLFPRDESSDEDDSDDSQRQHFHRVQKSPNDRNLSEDQKSLFGGRNFQPLLRDTTIAANMYLEYLQKMQKVHESARILWKSNTRNQTEMINNFIDANRPDLLQTRLFASKISLVINMTERLLDVTQSSIESARVTWNCCMRTIKAISKYFYENNCPLPTEDLLCRNFLMFYWHQLQPDMIEDSQIFKIKN